MSSIARPNISNRQPPLDRKDTWCFAFMAGFHFFFAVVCKELAGVTIERGPGFDWDASWHLMPQELLRFDLLETLWHLHAQPPLYNLWCAVFLKLFYPAHIAAMHYPQIVIGALISAMVYTILRSFVVSRRFSFGAALVLALNPSLILFEADLSYELLTAFWVVLAVFFLTLYFARRNNMFLYGCVAAINAVILTRSMFHLILLVPTILFVCLVSHRPRGRVFVVSVLISLASLGWYTKNYARSGFFGSSSWAGQNLWTIAAANYDRSDLERFVEEGVLEPIILAVRVWSRPGAYRRHGFDESCGIDALSRNNYNNINMVEISRLYKRNALRLIAHEPLHYASNVAKAYRIFCLPCSRTKYVRENARRLGWYEAFISQIVQGQYFTGLLKPFFNGKNPFLSFWFFVLPASIAALAAVEMRRCGWLLDDWLNCLREDGVMLFTCFIIAYVVAISTMCDYGENGRFKFAVEPVLWPFVIGICAGFLPSQE